MRPVTSEVQSDSQVTSKVRPFHTATAIEASIVPKASVSPTRVTEVTRQSASTPNPLAQAVGSTPRAAFSTKKLDGSLSVSIVMDALGEMHAEP